MSDVWVAVIVTAVGALVGGLALTTLMRDHETPWQRRRRERWEFASDKLRAFSDAHATATHNRQYLVTTKFEDSRESTVANSWCNTCGAAEIVVVTDKDVDDEQARRAVVA